ncbi:MAG TPA: F0F1 ATP synthase subunit A [Terriglobales bacterium]|jgi:F-type H+-transporting ATPase subunit a|nr:F0F1 ATP synthase subunit A [Terriglobales bacterium]
MEQLAFTQFLNHLFGGAVLALLQMLHIQPKHPAAPISDSFAMEVLVFLFLTLFFLAARLRLSVDSPGAVQHVVEGIEGFIGDMGDEVIGHHYRPYLPYLVALGLFILVANLIGLIPGLESPTGVPIVPLGCAITTWVYYNYQGVRRNGVLGYLKHFAGPVWWLAPLMFPIEIFSHLARVLSLTIRLFANMFAGEMVTLVFFSLVPLFVPIIFQGLHIGVAVIQTYIFVLLACVYLGEATAHEH